MAKKQPRFKTATQEAEWWAKNKNLIADRFEQAKATANSAREPWCELPANWPAKLERHQPSQSGWRKMTLHEPEPWPPRKGFGIRRTSKCCFTKL